MIIGLVNSMRNIQFPCLIFRLGSSRNVITDSPMSPPPISSSRSKPAPPTSKKSLLTMWTAKTEKKDFRQLTNTKLYQHLSHSSDDNRKGDSSKK